MKSEWSRKFEILPRGKLQIQLQKSYYYFQILINKQIFFCRSTDESSEIGPNQLPDEPNQLRTFKASFHDIYFFNKPDEQATEEFKNVLKSENIYAMAKSPTFNDGRPILVDLVTEKTRISSMLLMNMSMKNFVKPWDAVFQNFAPPRLDDKKMELGFIKTTGK